ncbi:hypothetical protein ACHQM5_023604 [Ranunculus cassubicifolius]
MNNDGVFEMGLKEFPHARSFDFLHHNHQQQQGFRHQDHVVYGHGSHVKGFSPNERIHVFDERTHGMYGDDDLSYHHHHKYKPVSPVNGFGLQSEGSSSSMVSWDDGSSTPPVLEESKPQNTSMNSHYMNGFWSERKLADESPLGKLSVETLMNGLGGMHIQDESVNSSTSRSLQSSFREYSPIRTDYGNVGNNRGFGNHLNGFSDIGRANCSFPMSPRAIKEDRRSVSLRLQQNCPLGSSCGSCLSPGEYNSLFEYVESIRFGERQAMSEIASRKLQLQGDPYLGCKCCEISVPCGTLSASRPSARDATLYHPQHSVYSGGCEDVPNSPGSYLTRQTMPLGMSNPTHYTLPTFNGRRGAATIGPTPHSPLRMTGEMKLEAFNCDDSIIVPGKGLHYRPKEHQSEIGIAQLKETRPKFLDQYCPRGTSLSNCGIESNASMNGPLPLSMNYNSLFDIQNCIYYMAKDQYGCRLLQHKLCEASPQEKRLISDEITEHVVELMMDPFGNFVVQKLFLKSNTEQRMKILLMLTREPCELVRISLNMHGARAVQKLISSLATREEKSVVISALEHGLFDLIRDMNGNRVLLHCLQHLPSEDNKFIFTGAIKFCFEIAAHRHGCCVLQRCITYATGHDREILISKLTSKAVFLAQDPFGNYVLQFVLELEIDSVIETVMSHFQGKYVMLSKLKHSSNVIEKCLKVYGEEGREMIVNELLSYPQFAMLLKDPYANYVIQTALQVTKGRLNKTLVEAILPYSAIIRSNPYCMKIFSWIHSRLKTDGH